MFSRLIFALSVACAPTVAQVPAAVPSEALDVLARAGVSADQLNLTTEQAARATVGDFRLHLRTTPQVLSPTRLLSTKLDPLVVRAAVDHVVDGGDASSLSCAGCEPIVFFYTSQSNPGVPLDTMPGPWLGIAQSPGGASLVEVSGMLHNRWWACDDVIVGWCAEDYCQARMGFELYDVSDPEEGLEVRVVRASNGSVLTGGPLVWSHEFNSDDDCPKTQAIEFKVQYRVIPPSGAEAAWTTAGTLTFQVSCPECFLDL